MGMLLVSALALQARQAPPATPWLLSLDEALSQARATQRPVLIVFSGDDWCAPCRQLREEVFDQPAFTAYAARHLVLLREDFPRRPENQLPPAQANANAAVSARFNPQGEFPLSVLIKADGTVIATSVGYLRGGPPAYIRLLSAMAPGVLPAE